MVQYRDKGSDHDRRRNEAAELRAVCRLHRAPLIVNDDVELAASIDADGVHLGRDDTAVSDARHELGTDAIVGVSCYNDLTLAIQAQAAGATYVAFGRFHQSRTKPGTARATPELLRAAQTMLEVPIVAIGGITPRNGGHLIACGASMLAVVHSVFGEKDVEQAARRLCALWG